MTVEVFICPVFVERPQGQTPYSIICVTKGHATTVGKATLRCDAIAAKRCNLTICRQRCGQTQDYRTKPCMSFLCLLDAAAVAGDYADGPVQFVAQVTSLSKMIRKLPMAPLTCPQCRKQLGDTGAGPLFVAGAREQCRPTCRAYRDRRLYQSTGMKEQASHKMAGLLCRAMTDWRSL